MKRQILNTVGGSVITGDRSQHRYHYDKKGQLSNTVLIHEINRKINRLVQI